MIRTATADDLPAIADAHRSAILSGCVGDYSPTQIATWVHSLDPAIYTTMLDARFVRIAMLDGAPAGFAATAIGEGLIDHLFVAEFAMRQGIATALLADAEEALLASGQHEVMLESTLNAVDFYAWQGYILVPGGRVLRLLGGGVGLAVVQMRKQLV